MVCAELNKISIVNDFEMRLRAEGDVKKITDGTYLLIANNINIKSSDIVNQLSAWVSMDIRLFVMRTSIDAAWALEPELDGWLSMNL